jgi:hypothetical protein
VPLVLGFELSGDANLPALAIEHQAELRTTVADFARIPRLGWKNRQG